MTAASMPPLRRPIRALRVTRRSAVKARAQAINQLRALLLTGPAELREQLRGLAPGRLVDACAGLRPTADLADPVQATKAALRRLARRHQRLSEEIRQLDAELAARCGQTSDLAMENPVPCAMTKVGTLYGDQWHHSD
jgi:transposase